MGIPIKPSRNLTTNCGIAIKKGDRAHTAEFQVPWQHGSVRIRAYDPTGAGRKPALLYLHGGGWTIFSIDTHDRIMREYAARARMVVIGVDYSLSPEVR